MGVTWSSRRATKFRGLFRCPKPSPLHQRSCPRAQHHVDLPFRPAATRALTAAALPAHGPAATIDTVSACGSSAKTCVAPSAAGAAWLRHGRRQYQRHACPTARAHPRRRGSQGLWRPKRTTANVRAGAATRMASGREFVGWRAVGRRRGGRGAASRSADGVPARIRTTCCTCCTCPRGRVCCGSLQPSHRTNEHSRRPAANVCAATGAGAWA